MKLRQVLIGVGNTTPLPNEDLEISGITYDSRKVKKGFLFVCIKGFKTDGHLFIKQAQENGAAAILAEDEPQIDPGIPLILCSNTRMALAIAAGNFYENPTKSFRLIGVTGTNGKTTTTHLIKAILEEAGKKVGIMGTLYSKVDDYQLELGHTTPEAPEIEAFMDVCRQKKADYVVMEVSSHALFLNRVDNLDFNAAVFTNLTQDHLDLHDTMEAYRDAKLTLFKNLKEDNDNFSIINADDEYAADFLNAAGKEAVSYGVKAPAAIIAKDVEVNLKGTGFKAYYKDIVIDVHMKLIGLFSVYNALAAIAFALREDVSPAHIISALSKVEGVPGRFEQVQCGQDFTVVVDYAHTPDGLENILATARGIVENRLITVFGCGGDRDRKKRPVMGEIAARYSDFTIVTSDNPRSEEPQAIINDIVPGVEKIEKSRYAIIVDRREAIKHAIYLARPGDLVVIAGKGHETYQLIKGQVLDFDDRKVAAEFLKGKD